MKKIILTSLIGLSSLALANQETPTTSTLEVTKEAAEKPARGMLPFIALGGGYTGYDTQGSVEGAPATLKLIGSYYYQSPYVADIGYGVNNQQFSQTAQSQRTAVTGGALELALRYKWENRWQAGLVADHLFEQGKYLSAEQGDAQFVGLQALKDFNLSQNWIGRVGARAMGLTNNTGSVVTMYLVEFQFGWNPQAEKPSVRQTAAQESQINKEPQFARPVAPVEPTPVMRDITLSNILSTEQGFHFRGARTALGMKDQQKLSRLAQALSDNTGLVEGIEILGYSDNKASTDRQQKISQARADHVRSLLRKNGLKDLKITAMGKGGEEASGNVVIDRRAEIIFIGVKDEDKLRRILSTVE